MCRWPLCVDSLDILVHSSVLHVCLDMVGCVTDFCFGFLYIYTYKLSPLRYTGSQILVQTQGRSAVLGRANTHTTHTHPVTG